MILSSEIKSGSSGTNRTGGFCGMSKGSLATSLHRPPQAHLHQISYICRNTPDSPVFVHNNWVGHVTTDPPRRQLHADYFWPFTLLLGALILSDPFVWPVCGSMKSHFNRPALWAARACRPCARTRSERARRRYDTIKSGTDSSYRPISPPRNIVPRRKRHSIEGFRWFLWKQHLGYASELNYVLGGVICG